jgi:predicted AlkP superfamily phosphohydrolase/phosphomutase
MSRVIIIGLDAATWDLLKPWADEGELPTFKRLMENAAWAVLESIIPPTTAPAWTSLSTGKNPGKHGIFDFVRLEGNGLRLYKPNDIRSETIYDILSKANLRSIVISLPLSFPPNGDFNGIMISDFLHTDKEILPVSKKEYIEDYRVIPDLSLSGESLLRDMAETAESQVEVAKRLFVREKWDFYFFYFPLTDSVLHSFWKDVSQNTAVGRKAKRIFHIADEFLKWLLGQMDVGDILFLVSDHGFASCPYKISLNKIFMERGLLKTRIKYPSEDETKGKHKAQLVEKLGGKSRRRVAVPRFLFKLAALPPIKPISKRVFRAVFGEARIELARAGIDFMGSKAFITTRWGIHIRERDREGYKALAREISETLSALEYKGQRVFKKVLRKDEVYSGPFIESAADILLIPNGFFLKPTLEEEVYGQNTPGGDHDLRGIFLAYGSDVRSLSEEPRHFKIYDVAPTVLHIFGLPIPRDMDGQVLKEIFKEGSEPARREVRYQWVDAEREKVKDKIRKLKGSTNL